MMNNISENPGKDLLVIGVGNTLREDDGVGIYLVNRLNSYFSFRLNCMEVYEPDIILAQKIAEFENLLIVDAMIMKDESPYKLVSVEPAKRFLLSGFLTHIFDWGIILAISKEFFGNVPKTGILGVSAFQFDFSESLSPHCQANAEKAFDFLIQYRSKQ